MSPPSRGARVLWLLNSPADFLVHRQAWARALLDDGVGLHVAGPAGPEAADIEALGIPYHAVPLDRRGLSPWREWRSMRAIRHVIDEVQPRLVHAFTIKPVIYGGLATRKTRTPIIQTITGLGFAYTDSSWRTRLLRAALDRLYRRALAHGHVVFQNRDDMAWFADRGLTRDGTLICGSGVDVEAFADLDAPDGPPVALFVGRYLVHKGIREFAQAARILHQQGVEGRFALAGDVDPGNRATVTRAEVDAWVRDGIVEDWGWQHDMAATLRKAHVVCLPSYREGMPRAILEASAAGRAVVAADAPGSRDVVEDGRTGLLVRVRDAEALSKALHACLHDEELRQRLGRAARQHVKDHFSDDVVNERFRTLYRRILEDPVHA